MKDFYQQLLKMATKKESTQEEKMIQNINLALSELYYARSNFDMVVGADNVELAILELNTAEKRYQNLIKEAKRIGITRFKEGTLSNKLVLKADLIE